MKLFPLMIIFLTLWNAIFSAEVTVGIEVLLNEKHALLKGKRVGLITNHTAQTSRNQTSVDLFKSCSKEKGFTLVALFAPEHGLTGALYASKSFSDEKGSDGIPIYSLHGKTQRPTPEMLKGIDILIFDIQDIGSRSYTYISTLFYAMEEAAKAKIPVIVADRPNPINGMVVDGPMLEPEWRSFLGYINVPYCHGMTVGELAKFFNEEYKIGCTLHVIPMKGWKRTMNFVDTGLPWIPTSPNIPEASTPLYYPMTGILGELRLVSIGIGYTLPFKLIGAPWIDAKKFAAQLNSQKLPGVVFFPFHFKPSYGRFAHEMCQGSLIVVTDPLIYKPVTTQYVIIGVLKSTYPKRFAEALQKSTQHKDLFCKVNGTETVFKLLHEKPYIIWELRELHRKEREDFMPIRKKYLLSNYNS
jgi:uncharacterized protein YbbC (DUF1343 family)